MLALYSNIRELRKMNKWTQEELAQRMGYTDRSMIAKIEAGKVDLAQSKILEFAKVFGVSAGDLMGEDVPYDEQAWRAKKIIDLYKNVPPDVQAAVETLLKSSQQKP